MSLSEYLLRQHQRMRATPMLRRFTAFTRLAVALGFVPSGLVKVIGHRFTQLGTDTAVGFVFEAFYRSGIWYRVVGLAQVTAAVLLFFPRTAHLGALLFLPIIFNIWLVTIGVGFGNTIAITSLMLLANIFLVCWEYDRVAALLAPRARAARAARERVAPWSVTFALLGLLVWGGAVRHGHVDRALHVRPRGIPRCRAGWRPVRDGRRVARAGNGLMSTPLREQVHAANLELYRRRLARFTFGNASAIDRANGMVCIKPSGVSCEGMSPADIVMVDLDGRVQAGALRPSSDTPTHLALYRAFPLVGGIAHAHSRFATAWAQARREVPCLGTTHADFCEGPVPLTDDLSASEIAGDYESNTGAAIVRRMERLDPARVPAVLVAGHAPFCWGATVGEAVEAAAMLEEVARLAWLTVTLHAGAAPISGDLLRKHFDRKHGRSAYYGQDVDRSD